jgi:Holliday junction resolvase RusA-like endonuclease
LWRCSIKFKGEIKNDYELRYRHNFRRDCDDAGDTVSLGDIAEKLNIEPAKVTELKRYDKIKKQLNRLSVLDDTDWPGVLKNLYVHVLCGDLEGHFPFNFHISGVVSSVQKKHSETDIQKKFETYSNKFSQGKILSPIELDIQVRTKNKRPTKDLDNIVKNISPFLQRHVLSDESYIYGYRIYIVDNPHKHSNLEGLRIKLVPPFSINDYESMIEEVIEEGQKWLERTVSL